MTRNRKFLLLVVVGLLAGAYIAYVALDAATGYYYTVGEVKELGASAYGEQMRITGEVMEDSIVVVPEEVLLRFSLADDTQSLPVLYRGATPDSFGEGREIVVGGLLNAEGILEADTIMAKCSSKDQSASQ